MFFEGTPLAWQSMITTSHRFSRSHPGIMVICLGKIIPINSWAPDSGEYDCPGHTQVSAFLWCFFPKKRVLNSLKNALEHNLPEIERSPPFHNTHITHPCQAMFYWKPCVIVFVYRAELLVCPAVHPSAQSWSGNLSSTALCVTLIHHFWNTIHLSLVQNLCWLMMSWLIVVDYSGL